MEKKDIVEILDNNSISLFKLVKKWIEVWDIPLKNILHGLNHLKKSELLGLINGNYVLVKNAKDTIQKAKAFNTANKQFHTCSFKKVINKSSETLRVINLRNINILISKDNQNDYDLENMIGKENIVQSETEALEILYATVVDAYRDHNWNIVHYFDSDNTLCYVSCDLREGDWYFDAQPANKNSWSDGVRLFYPIIYN